MTKQQIVDAANMAQVKGEDLQLWQAAEWMYHYGLMSYKEYHTFTKAQIEARNKARETA